MALSFRAKLLASHLAVVAAVVLVTILALNRTLGADLVQRTENRLREQARGAHTWVSAGRHPERIVTRLADVIDARVTITDTAGEVLADSGPRAGTRDGEQMYWVSEPMEDDMVIKLGVPMREVRATLDSMRRRILVAAAFGLLAAAGLALLAARVAARPLRTMTEAAARIAQGEYKVELPPPTRDEFGVLARALDSLAQQLGAKIGELTGERDRLATILTGMVEGVIVIGADGRVQVSNPSAQALTGGAAQTGRTLDEAVPDARVRALLAAALEGAPASEAEIGAVGTPPRALVLNVRPLPRLSGGGAVAVLHDVTRLRLLEEARRDFVANASHELRTPVTAIRGYAETLVAGGVDEPTRKQFLEIIQRHGERIGRLVEDMLALSALEARAPGDAVRESVSLVGVATQVEATLRKSAEARGIKVRVDVAPDLQVRGDPDGLEQVAQNLVDNAVKYGKAGGEVVVRGRRTGAACVLEVADDGPGIAAQHLPHLFERFYRVDPSRSREQGGTGLGLAIVKHLCEAMAGTVTVRSEVGKGTVFTVEWPSA